MKKIGILLLVVITICSCSAGADTTSTENKLYDFKLNHEVKSGDYRIKMYDASQPPHSAPTAFLMFHSFNPKLVKSSTKGVNYLVKIFDGKKSLLGMVNACKKSQWTSVNIPFSDNPPIDEVKYFSVEISDCDGSRAT